MTALLYLFLFFGCDDFLIDLCAWILKARPKGLTTAQLEAIQSTPEKKIAILIAAWKEEDVIRHMIRGNHARIKYNNYTFFIGVYPNDLKTLAEAQLLAAEVPNVVIVVNPMEGPTCKGQMLNVMVRSVFQSEAESNTKFDAFMIHDSEDLIHPLEFQVVNGELDTYDFIQIPVFSLPVSPFSLVAGIYIDEFAESHTKSILVRNNLGVPIPSAGVGTTISRKFVLDCLEMNAGELLNIRSLTEDYELGLTTRKFEVKSKFSCYHFKNSDGNKEYIATREYFPKSFKASVRQKSRWTLGIAYQGLENLGWSGNTLHKYFLFRDRKGPFCNALVMGSLTLSIYLSGSSLAHYPAPSILFLSGLDTLEIQLLISFNSFLIVNRLFQRIRSVKEVYGWKLALFCPIRWPVANLINFLATLKATQQYIQNKILGTQPKWIKTTHELPEGFGEQLESL